MTRTIARFALLGAAAIALSACGAAERIADIGKPPSMNNIENPVTAPGYQPVNMPMPNEELHVREANSLWRSGSRAFFKDQRAARVGDILTVNISIADQAKLDNATKRSRSNDDNQAIPELFGFQTQIQKILPSAADPSNLVDVSSDSQQSGEGAVDRKETIETTVAAVVTQILPNGNLVIQGSQEVRVNFELRELTVAGVVRPEDISSRNTIDQTQIAEARISYGGRGQITDVQQARYGQQLLDIISPF